VKKIVLDFVYGIIFGITQTVPGVSGGTIAIMLGFYEELLDSINNITKDMKRCLKFLMPLMMGIGVGIVAFSSVISHLLIYHFFVAMAFFIGMIVGIMPPIYGKIGAIDGKKIALIVLPAVVLIVMAFISTDDVVNPTEVVAGIDAPYMFYIFLGGMITAAGLIIPGVSGTFFLLMMGIYPVATYSIGSMRFLLEDVTNIPLIVSILQVLAPLGIGVIIGGLLTARLIDNLLKNYSETVYSIIFGLMIGSVVALAMDLMPIEESGGTVALAIGALVVGFGISFVIGKKKI